LLICNTKGIFCAAERALCVAKPSETVQRRLTTLKRAGAQNAAAFRALLFRRCARIQAHARNR
jgi:hypothetical protein